MILDIIQTFGPVRLDIRFHAKHAKKRIITKTRKIENTKKGNVPHAVICTRYLCDDRPACQRLARRGATMPAYMALAGRTKKRFVGSATVPTQKAEIKAQWQARWPALLTSAHQ